MKNNQLKTLCMGLIVGISFQACASSRIEKIHKDSITLQSQDGQDFTLDEKVAKLSKTVRGLSEDVDTSDTIPLPNVRGKTLALIAELLPHLKDLLDKNPEDGSKINFALRPLVASVVEREFLHLPELERRSQTLDRAVEMLLAVNYLDIPNLINSTAAVIADQIPENARAAVVKLFTASASEEAENKDKEISTAKEELVTQHCGSLIEIPRDIRPLILLNLSMLQAIEIKNVEGAIALIMNPHFTPGATVLEMLRNNKDFAESLVKRAAHTGNQQVVIFLSRNNLINLTQMIGNLLFAGHTYPEDGLFIVVETLLNEGADPHKIKTIRPFTGAIAQGHPRIASLFLDRGIDPNGTMTSGESALQAAQRLGYTELADRIRLAQRAKTRKPF